MNKIYSLFLLSIVLCLGCNSDDNGTNPNNPNGGLHNSVIDSNTIAEDDWFWEFTVDTITYRCEGLAATRIAYSSFLSMADDDKGGLLAPTGLQPGLNRGYLTSLSAFQDNFVPSFLPSALGGLATNGGGFSESSGLTSYDGLNGIFAKADVDNMSQTSISGDFLRAGISIPHFGNQVDHGELFDTTTTQIMAGFYLDGDLIGNKLADYLENNGVPVNNYTASMNYVKWLTHGFTIHQGSWCMECPDDVFFGEHHVTEIPLTVSLGNFDLSFSPLGDIRFANDIRFEFDFIEGESSFQIAWHRDWITSPQQDHFITNCSLKFKLPQIGDF